MTVAIPATCRAGPGGSRLSTKPSKYHAQKVVVDGIPFDSKAEAAFYQHLRLLERAGEVVGIELQPAFTLQETLRKFSRQLGKVRTWRKRTYTADFRVRYSDGRDVIYDVKGVKTEAFGLRQALFEARYPDLELVLVKKKGGRWVYWS
jgi:hypothetical protein